MKYNISNTRLLTGNNNNCPDNYYLIINSCCPLILLMNLIFSVRDVSALIIFINDTLFKKKNHDAQTPIMLCYSNQWPCYLILTVNLISQREINRCKLLILYILFFLRWSVEVLHCHVFLFLELWWRLMDRFRSVTSKHQMVVACTSKRTTK